MFIDSLTPNYVIQTKQNDSKPCKLWF
jgi:hypothetical protein